MRISLIITTYNWPQALDLVLRSVSRQTRLPDEVIVCDDGSGEETARVVASWAARLPVPVHHLWQENRGFRAGRSRNRGIAASRGEYVIAIDGDMVLHEEFVADHEQAAKPGWFVQGVRIPTTQEGAQRLLRGGLTSIDVFTPGLRRRHLALRSRWLAHWLSPSPVPMARLKSCNQGFWRSDLIAVNGFEENMIGWGPEDKECCARLLHRGVRGRELRFAALAAHLYHPVRAPRGANPNDALLDATLANRRTRSELGLDQHLAEFATGIPQSARPPWNV
ncbi:MAG TPA: glycosyltransferase family 2 protein [Steroidobacteraceae bacterium]|nr:glycosyltransferase family 2 protein [Steroidobacteraceae bacterium]